MANPLRSPGLKRTENHSPGPLPDHPIIPPLPANSLTTSNYKWLHPEAWNDSHLEFFKQTLKPAFWSIAKPFPFVKQRHKSPPQIEGRWILETEGKKFEMVAEAVGFYGTYRRSVLNVDVPVNHWSDDLLDPTAFLITALFAMNQADTLYLFSQSDEVIQAFKEHSLGEATSTWRYSESNLYRGESSPLTSDFTFKIDRYSWEKSTWGQDHSIALSYLAKRRRIANADGVLAPSRLKSRRRPRSLFSRLFQIGPKNKKGPK